MEPTSFHGRTRSDLLLLRLAEAHSEGMVAAMAAATNGALTDLFRMLRMRPDSASTRVLRLAVANELERRHPSIRAALADGRRQDQDWGVEDLVEVFLTDLAPDATGPAPWRCQECGSVNAAALEACRQCVMSDRTRQNDAPVRRAGVADFRRPAAGQ